MKKDASIRVIGGKFDDGGGKRSKIVDMIVKGVHSSEDYKFKGYHNSGYYQDLGPLLENACKYADVILWFADVPNNLPKLHDIKERNSRIILVTSKRNTDDEYAFQDIMARALAAKSNLIVEFKKSSESKAILMRLLDPLGNQWFPKTEGFSNDPVGLGAAIAKRARELMDIDRKSLVPSPEEVVPMRTGNDYKVWGFRTLDMFLDTIKRFAGTFSDLIRPANGVTRYLGNASFRCERGFPSVKFDEKIYVSRRNVDKAHINEDAFVQIGKNDTTDTLWYRGEYKPSVDAPIQLALYGYMPQIRFMIHSHVYVKDAPFTSKMIPCGGLQEIDEVMAVIKENKLIDSSAFAINLLGHGSIIFACFPWTFDQFEHRFYARPRPEIME